MPLCSSRDAPGGDAVLLPRQAREVHRVPPPRARVGASSVVLSAVLARALAEDDAVGRAALDAVASEARAARAAGRSPNQIVTLVRRSLAAAAPGPMTAAAFDAVARRLVQHALRSCAAADATP
jgi:hypothetical protein